MVFKEFVRKVAVAGIAGVVVIGGLASPSAASVQVFTQSKKITCTSSTGPMVVIRGTARGSVDHKFSDLSYYRYLGSSANYWTESSRTNRGGTRTAVVVARYDGNNAITSNSSYCST